MLKTQNFILNCCEESIVTLIIKYRDQQNKLDYIKADLLQNATTDFYIASKNYSQTMEEINKNKLIVPKKSILNIQDDIIVFTYDQFSNQQKQKTIFSQKNYVLKLSQIKNQKTFRKELQNAFDQKQTKGIEIKLNYQSHYMHLNFILFLAKQFKEMAANKKKIIVIVQLHRFSLIQLKIENINISYKHKFQQYFLENLQPRDQTLSLLDCSNCYSLYEKIKTQNQFDQLLIEAIKLVNFRCLHHHDERLIFNYFTQCLDLSKNQQFVQNCKRIIKQKLQQLLVDFNFLQSNQQIVRNCSNVHEAIQKYIFDIVTEIIFYILKFIIDEEYLFFFKNHKSFEVIYQNYIYENKNENQDFVLNYDSDCKAQEKQIQQIFIYSLKEDLNKLSKNMSQFKAKIKFSRIVQSNIVIITKQITLLPLSGKDFKRLYSKKNMYNQMNNLQDIASNIPFRVVEANRSQYQTHFKNSQNFINSFQIMKNGFFQVISRNRKLQKMYLFDLLNSLLEHLAMSKDNICWYVKLLQKILNSFDLRAKILLIVSNKYLIKHIFQLFSIIIKYKQGQEIINFFRQLDRQKFSYSLIEFMQQLFDIGTNTASLNPNSLKQFQKKGNYIRLLKQINPKIRQIHNRYCEYSLNIEKQFIYINQLLEIFQKLKKNQNEEIKKFMTLRMQNCNISLLQNIYIYCIKQLLPANKQKNQELIILNYLSLNIFYYWVKQIYDNRPLNQMKLSNCIKEFVLMCNKYSLFANNATFFIQQLLSQLTEQRDIRSMRHYLRATNQIPQQLIQMSSNFTVALSNCIGFEIQLLLDNNVDRTGNISKFILILRNYKQTFYEIVDDDNGNTKLYELFRIQFAKIFSLCYLDSLLNNTQNQHLNQIDPYLCQQTPFMRHIRLYLFKNIYDKLKNVENIKKFFIQSRRCQWIALMSNYLQQKIEQSCIPPRVLPKNHRIYLLIQKLQENQFRSNPPYFNQLISQGLKDPLCTYQLLTYFMLNFYRDSIAQNKILILQNQLERRVDLNRDPYKKLVKLLLLKYMQKQVTSIVTLIAGPNSSQLFFLTQLTLLNYLNIVVSLNKLKCPLLQMFFNQYGEIPNDFVNNLNKKYLIGSMQNPALGRLNFILKRHKQKFMASSYMSCSAKCDYLAPVGGVFYGGKSDGCPQPQNINKCPFCRGLIGAEDDQNANPQSQTFEPSKVMNFESTILKRQQVGLIKGDRQFVYNLLGYQNGNSQQQLKQWLQNKKFFISQASDFLQGESQLVHHKILQAIINFVWHFLAQNRLIREAQISNLLTKPIEQAKQFLFDASLFYLNEASKSLKLNNRNDEVVWHLGVGNMLLNFIINDKSYQDKSLSLNKQKVRDQFQTQISDLLFSKCQMEKQKFIIQNRRVQTVDRFGIVIQRGSLTHHLNSYDLIRLFKLNRHSPSYQDMKNNYNQILNRQHLLLYYLMNNQDVQRHLINLGNVLMFIPKIWKKFNSKITRQDSQTPLNQIIFKKQYDSQVITQNQMNTFITSWNQLSKSDNFQLQNGCHTANKLGKLQLINKATPLNNFILQTAHYENIKSKKLIAFVKVLAQYYNKTCMHIQNIIKTKYPQSQQMFNPIPINPLMINNQSKLAKFPTRSIKQKIHKYSSLSVEYGISAPYYPFDHIQSLICRQFYGCRFLISNPDDFWYFNFIGQRNDFIDQIKNDQRQKPLEIFQSNRIVEFIKQLRKRQNFYQTIRGIQGSLESIIFYYKHQIKIKNNQRQNNHQQIIRQYINEKQIKGIVSHVLEEPIQSIKLTNIIDLYQYFEFQTFQRVVDKLDGVYKTQLDEFEKKQLNKVLNQLRRNDSKSPPTYIQFKKALYRLAGRNLCLMITKQNIKISDSLFYIQSFWPKNIEISQLQDSKSDFAILMNKLTLSKVGSILTYLPFRELDQNGNNPIGAKINVRPPQGIIKIQKRRDGNIVND